MKIFITTSLLLCTISNAFASDFYTALTGGTLLSVESATGNTLLSTGFVSLLVQSRGTAGREQLKDDLVPFNEDFRAGRVSDVEGVRQTALRELFMEIEKDEAQMSQLNSAMPEGSNLSRIATAVTVALFEK